MLQACSTRIGRWSGPQVDTPAARTAAPSDASTVSRRALPWKAHARTRTRTRTHRRTRTRAPLPGPRRLAHSMLPLVLLFSLPTLPHRLVRCAAASRAIKSPSRLSVSRANLIGPLGGPVRLAGLARVGLAHTRDMSASSMDCDASAPVDTHRLGNAPAFDKAPAFGCSRHGSRISQRTDCGPEGHPSRTAFASRRPESKLHPGPRVCCAFRSASAPLATCRTQCQALACSDVPLEAAPQRC